jgi:DNA polymerase III subunit alpha
MTRGYQIDASKIISIESMGTQDVYDLTVDSEDHSWVANGGIITHNSHASAYSLISYQTAWLKYYYPTEFMAALMTSVSDRHTKLAVYLAECRWMGIEVLPPDINAPTKDFQPVGDKQVRFGLSAIRSFGDVAIKTVLEHSPYADLGDMFLRTSGQGITKAAWLNLIKAGALDTFGFTRKALAEDLDKMLLLAKHEKASQDAGLPPLGIRLEPTTVQEFPKKDILAAEVKVLSLYVSGHPLESLWPMVEDTHPQLIAELDESLDGKVLNFAGLVTDVYQRTDRDNNPWAICTLEDPTGEIEFLLFSNAWPQAAPHVKPGTFLELRAFVRFRDGSPSLYANDIFIPDRPLWSRLDVTLTEDTQLEEITSFIQESLANPFGDESQSLYIFFPNEDGTRDTIKVDGVKITNDVITQITELCGSDCVRVR